MPVSVTGGRLFEAIMVFYGGGCAVTGEGRAWCWGEFDGDGTQNVYFAPARVRSVREL